ncbi:MAG: PEP-CTERM sorting domain-containing protein [Gemmatimonadales bacterium]|nr:PEP-CTERM sorting domain-containing protein [Gemmatimonadales bacterium]
MNTTSRLVAAGALLAGVAAPAAAQTRVLIDFSPFRSAVTTEFQALPGGDVYQHGFGIFATFGNGARNALGTWGTDAVQERADLFANVPTNLGPTSAAMWGTQFAEQMNLFREDGRTFRLHTIDLAHMYARSYLISGDLAPFSVRFFGIPAGQTTFSITQDCPLTLAPIVGNDRPPQLQTCTFDSRWRNVREVAWLNQGQQGNSALAGSAFSHQFTNIDATIVPEPGTWAFMATGLLGLAAAARRRRSA